MHVTASIAVTTVLRQHGKATAMQAVEAETPMAEAEQGAALVAWFTTHYAKLDGQALLYTQLEGAGPEIGVRQEQPRSDGLAPPQHAGYDIALLVFAALEAPDGC